MFSPHDVIIVAIVTKEEIKMKWNDTSTSSDSLSSSENLQSNNNGISGYVEEAEEREEMERDMNYDYCKE